MYVYYFHLLLGRSESVFPQRHSHIAFPWTLCTAVDQFQRVACLFCPASVPRQSHAAPNIRLCGPPFSHHLVAHADSFPGAVPARVVYHRHGRGGDPHLVPKDSGDNNVIWWQPAQDEPVSPAVPHDLDRAVPVEQDGEFQQAARRAAGKSSSFDSAGQAPQPKPRAERMIRIIGRGLVHAPGQLREHPFPVELVNGLLLVSGQRLHTNEIFPRLHAPNYGMGMTSAPAHLQYSAECTIRTCIAPGGRERQNKFG